MLMSTCQCPRRLLLDHPLKNDMGRVKRCRSYIVGRDSLVTSQPRTPPYSLAIIQKKAIISVIRARKSPAPIRRVHRDNRDL